MKTVVNEDKSSRVLAEEADTGFKEFLGLMLRSSGKMLFKIDSYQKIHSFFVFSTLHLYYFYDDKVVEIALLPPWSTYENSCKSDYLLESFEKLNYKKGDKIRII